MYGFKWLNYISSAHWYSNGNNTSFCPVSVKTFAIPVPTSISRKARSHIMPCLAHGMGWDRMWKFTLLVKTGVIIKVPTFLDISCGVCYFRNKNIYIIHLHHTLQYTCRFLCELLPDSRDYGYALLLCWFSTSLFWPSHWTHLPTKWKNGYICQMHMMLTPWARW